MLNDVVDLRLTDLIVVGFNVELIECFVDRLVCFLHPGIRRDSCNVLIDQLCKELSRDLIADQFTDVSLYCIEVLVPLPLSVLIVIHVVDVVLTHPIPDSHSPDFVAVWIFKALNLFSHSGCKAIPYIARVVFTSQVLHDEVSYDAFVPTVVDKISLLWARLPVMSVILAELRENLVLQVSLIRVKIVLEEVSYLFRESLVV